MKNIYLQMIYKMEKISNYYHLYSNNKRHYDTDDVYYENEVHILSEIVENNDITLVEIADIFYKTKSYISQVISNLELKQLVVKTKSENDKRKSSYKVTEKGMLIYYAHLYYDQKQSERLKKFLENYTAREVDAILKFLDDFHSFQQGDTPRDDRELR